MEITTVHYQHVINLGNYENERIGAWAQVAEDESPEEALAALTAWVERQGKETAEAGASLEQIREAIQRAEARRRQLEREYEQMHETWEKAKAFLTRLGLELPRSYVDHDDIPF